MLLISFGKPAMPLSLALQVLAQRLLTVLPLVTCLQLFGPSAHPNQVCSVSCKSYACMECGMNCLPLGLIICDSCVCAMLPDLRHPDPHPAAQQHHRGALFVVPVSTPDLQAHHLIPLQGAAGPQNERETAGKVAT